ncbi:CheY-like chemotaxis protein [Massilia sp. UYP32]|uniref:response regulator n=1 Tax=Massilia sp. UYP32 TaxID=1756386 RepID=UPI003D23A1C8
MGQQSPSRRILVVDDNADAAELVAQLLALQGHEVVFACSGVEALAAAERLDPEVVFLDIGMPGMDGYQVASALRRSGRFPRTRIVALTAWGSAKAREWSAAKGFDAHLVKPARAELLLSEAARTASIH